MAEKADVLAVIDEVIDRLAKFSERIGRQVELIVNPDEGFTVMVAEESYSDRPEELATGYESAAQFIDFGALMNYLESGVL